MLEEKPKSRLDKAEDRAGVSTPARSSSRGAVDVAPSDSPPADGPSSDSIAADKIAADSIAADKIASDRAPASDLSASDLPSSGAPERAGPILDQNAIDQAVSDRPIAAADLPPGASRAGRNLPVAIGVGVGLAAAVVASLVIYRPAFLFILAAAVLISVWELNRALRSARVRPPLVPLLLGSVAMIAVTWLSGPSGLAVTTLLTVLAGIVWRLSDGPVGYFRDTSAAVLITAYVPLLASFAVLLLRADDGVTRIVAFIVVVVCSDVGGYAAGVLFGMHPMSPTISPKKSWEGMAGSVLVCMIGGVLLLTLALDGTWWQGALYGAAIAVTATVGDLGESVVKRDLGIKDMGNLLPGHGGLMDRMDSLLPSAAVAYLLLTAFVPPVIS